MPIFGKKSRKEQEAPVVVQPPGFGNRTPEQIQQALGAAHEARKIRKAFMEDVRSGKVSLEDILLGDYSDNPVAQNIPVRTLLRSLHGVGPARANRIIDKMQIPEGRRVRGLGVHQRAALVDWRNANLPAEGEE